MVSKLPSYFHLFTIDKGIIKDKNIGLKGRGVYFYLRYFLGDGWGVISYKELQDALGISEYKIRSILNALQKSAFIEKTYVWFRVETGLRRKMKIKALCFDEIYVPKKELLDNNLTISEKGLLLCLYVLSTPFGKIYYSKRALKKELFLPPYSSEFERALNGLLEKKKIKKISFGYAIIDYIKSMGVEGCR